MNSITKSTQYCLYAIGLMVAYSNVHADLKSDVGYTRLQTELNFLQQSIPTGSGVQVLMAEACTNLFDDDSDPSTPPICLAWLPDTSDSQLQAKTLSDISVSTSGLFSSHATGVARLLFGNTSSITPDIDLIDIYLADHWLGAGYLQTANPNLLPTASSNRIANHSWVGTVGTSASAQVINGDILRRVDWLIPESEF